MSEIICCSIIGSEYVFKIIFLELVNFSQAMTSYFFNIGWPSLKKCRNAMEKMFENCCFCQCLGHFYRSLQLNRIEHRQNKKRIHIMNDKFCPTQSLWLWSFYCTVESNNLKGFGLKVSMYGRVSTIWEILDYQKAVQTT